MDQIYSLGEYISKNISIETKTRMRKALDDLVKESNDRFEDVKSGIDQINEIILALKKIEEIVDNIIVSKRIRLWNPGQPKPKVSWHDRWVERDKMRLFPEEELKVKKKISFKLIKAQEDGVKSINVQRNRNDLIKFKVDSFKRYLNDNTLAEYIRYLVGEKIVTRYFLDAPIIQDTIRDERTMVKTTEEHKTTLLEFKRELEQQIQENLKQYTSLEQDTSLSQEKRLRNVFDKLYTNYRRTSKNPKDIPDYFNCAISLDTIMFPMSRKDNSNNVFTYESEEIIKVLMPKITTDMPIRDPLTQIEVSLDNYMPDPIFESLLDEFIIDPEAYYEKYDTTDYKTAHIQEEKGLTKDEASIYLKNAHLQKDRNLTKDELITFSAGKRKTKQKNKRIPKQTQQKKYTNKRRQKQTNKRRQKQTNKRRQKE